MQTATLRTVTLLFYWSIFLYWDLCGIKKSSYQDKSHTAFWRWQHLDPTWKVPSTFAISDQLPTMIDQTKISSKSTVLLHTAWENNHQEIDLQSYPCPGSWRCFLNDISQGKRWIVTSEVQGTKRAGAFILHTQQMHCSQIPLEHP